MRSGTVALVGRSNVGKSTFLNAVLGEPLAIVSPLPQTTRDTLLGVVHRAQAQIAFLDTPGLHRPRSELGRRMNAVAKDALAGAAVVVLMTDVERVRRRVTAGAAADPEDLSILEQIPQATPALVVVNKIDLLRDKSLLLPLLSEMCERRVLAAIVPVSVRADDGLLRVLDEIERALPEAEPAFGEDTLTDRSTRWLAAEYLREQVLLGTRGEVPHAVAVSIDRFDESDTLVVVQATLHVEKHGQRGIMIGQGGTRIKELGIRARQRIEALVGRRVHLELFVRLTPRWRNAPRLLAELGYQPPRRPE